MSDLTIFSAIVENRPLREMNAKTIDEFVQHQSEQGLKAATINRRLSAISSFFDYLIVEAEDDGGGVGQEASDADGEPLPGDSRLAKSRISAGPASYWVSPDRPRGVRARCLRTSRGSVSCVHMLPTLRSRHRSGLQYVQQDHRG